MIETNTYCKALGIKVPCLEDVRNSPEANFYSLLIVALLERGDLPAHGEAFGDDGDQRLVELVDARAQ